MVKRHEQMLSNIIDKFDRTNHFDRIIFNQTIEHIDTNIITAWLLETVIRYNLQWAAKTKYGL